MILSCNNTKDSFGATRCACLPAARGDNEEFGLFDGVEDFDRCHAAFGSEGGSIKSLPDGLWGVEGNVATIISYAEGARSASELSICLWPLTKIYEV